MKKKKETQKKNERIHTDTEKKSEGDIEKANSILVVLVTRRCHF